MKSKKGIENFLMRVGSVFQIFPEQIRLEYINPNYSNKYTLKEQNARAVADDWNNIGLDINKAVKKFKEQYKK
ncbi:hypothetical protein GYA25_02860 [Candidatus Woesearchaeota archaeon]|jgi:hypothetical protein|nr:hypothetical protein [Candidatus Woesearchaeota archaeon]